MLTRMRTTTALMMAPMLCDDFESCSAAVVATIAFASPATRTRSSVARAKRDNADYGGDKGHGNATVMVFTMVMIAPAGRWQCLWRYADGDSDIDESGEGNNMARIMCFKNVAVRPGTIVKVGSRARRTLRLVTRATMTKIMTTAASNLC